MHAIDAAQSKSNKTANSPQSYPIWRWRWRWRWRWCWRWEKMSPSMRHSRNGELRVPSNKADALTHPF
ncbi:hypothetical protein BHE74_00032561 [Ensete ventricosum]|nr:hypothetical protein BHE74_00032561 [Ensete ventricosum]